MNVMNDIAEARASAVSLRASAKACTREQGALKFRLTRAADSLDAVVLLAIRWIERVDDLEQELRELKLATVVPLPANVSIPPVLVSNVNVALLALTVRLLRMVAYDLDEAGAGELCSSLQTAQRVVQRVFDDLREASAGGAS